MDKIEVTLPSGWDALAQDDLRFVYAMMVLYSDRREAWRYVALRFVLSRLGFYDVCPYGDGFEFMYVGERCFVQSSDFLPAIDAMRWLSEIPKSPVRLDVIGGSSALPPDPTQEMSFSQWMAVENLYQGFQFTQDQNLLTEMACILYGSESIDPAPAGRLSVFYWWSSVKAMVSRRFPHFFRPAPVGSGSEPPSYDELRRSNDAQIRALTKGDITKEDAVLNMPADRALTELDALAREYEELNRKYPQKN